MVTSIVRKVSRPLVGKEKTMSRSNSKTAQSTTSRSAETPVRAARSIKNYTFEYQRDRVSRQAGSSYFRLESNASGGGNIQMTLQEVQSLYNFLGNVLNG